MNEVLKILHRGIFPICPTCQKDLAVLDEFYKCETCGKEFDRISGEVIQEENEFELVG